MGTLVEADQVFLDRRAIVDVANEPAAFQALRNVGCYAASSEGVANQIALVGCQLDDAFEDDWRQFVRRPILVLAVAHRRYIVPDIGEVQAFGVQVLLMPAIILNVLSAMAARLDRSPHQIAVERAGL